MPLEVLDDGWINALVLSSAEKAKELSIENFPHITKARYNCLFSLIKGNINSFFSYESDNDILSLVSKIFFNLLTTHSLLNGNKRFATSVMILMLYNFGYFFWMEKYYSQEVEEKILNFLMTWENRKMLNKEITIDKIISEIKDWISCNATIALNFRNKI